MAKHNLISQQKQSPTKASQFEDLAMFPEWSPSQYVEELSQSYLLVEHMVNQPLEH